ncbi:MAG: DUF3667 domain-containing protein [Bacteroidota bacterium]
MRCKNCHTELIQGSDYCHHCGAKVIRNRLTFRNLFEHISETFLNYDNKLLRTYIDLFKRPEVVLDLYVNGVRKRYVNPISYFGLAITLTGLYMFLMNKYFPEMFDFSSFVAEGQEEIQKRNTNFLQEYQSLVMMFYIPVYAIIAWLTFLGLKKYNYTELLVIFMYLQAQISLTSIIITPIVALLGFSSPWFGMITLPLMVIYNYYCLKRLYQLNTGQMLLRTLLFFAIFVILFIILTIIFGIIMYLNGDFQRAVEARQRAMQN